MLSTSAFKAFQDYLSALYPCNALPYNNYVHTARGLDNIPTGKKHVEKLS